MQGLQFGLSQAQANYWIHRLLPVVRAALDQLELLPERDGTAVAASALAVEGTPDLALDGTERRRQRPQYLRRKKRTTAARKKPTPIRTSCSSESTHKVVYLGPTEAGAKHDKKAADDAAIAYPAQATLDEDTGFQGYAPAGVLTCEL